MSSSSTVADNKKRPAARNYDENKQHRFAALTPGVSGNKISKVMHHHQHRNEENLTSSKSNSSLRDQLVAIRARKHAQFASQKQETNAKTVSNSNGGSKRGKISGGSWLPLPSVIAGKYSQAFKSSGDNHSHQQPEPINDKEIQQQQKQNRSQKTHHGRHQRQLVELRIQTCIGMQYCDDQPAITQASNGDEVLLELEPSNLYDPNAIRVVHQIQGKKLGYIVGNENKELGQLLSNNSATSKNTTIEAIISQKTDKYILLLVRVYDDQETSVDSLAYLQPPSTATRHNHGSTISTTQRLMHGWIRWIPQQESLEDFALSIRPSRIDASTCHWIYVENHNQRSVGYKATQLTTVTLGTAHDDDHDSDLMLTGKWLVFLSRKNHDSVDSTWMKIALATAQGKLGCGSKIAPAGGEATNPIYSSSTVCCVYVKDYTNKQELKRVLLSLKDILGPKQRISGFKTDMATTMDEYGTNTTLYTEKEVLKW